MDFPKVRKAYYDSLGGQVHYRYLLAAPSTATDKAPILLLHMSACSSIYYKEMIQRLSAAGHDVYAPDMPGFGASYDPSEQPAGISFYVDTFMLLIADRNIPKFHVFGHHSGASIAIEMAVLHPDRVLTLSVCGAALMTPEEQKEIAAKEIVMYNKPVADGSHLMKVWKYLEPQGDWDVVDMHTQALDAYRAYEGRIQVYTCVFSQPVLELLKQVKCPLLGMSSEGDMLYPYLPRAKELHPDSAVAIVKGVDFEVCRDADGVSGYLLDFFGSH